MGSISLRLHYVLFTPENEFLGWDLVDLPTSDGYKHLDGLTSDQRPIGFRFSGGWLTVERGAAVNAPPDSGAMEEILSVSIAPFGVMDIEPEQVCDILGLTVNGRKIVSGMGPRARGFDWSGRTTYWESSHLMEHRGDAEMFIRKLSQAFTGSVLVQPLWEESAMRLKFRRINFLVASGETVTIGVGFDKALLERMLAAEEVSTAEFEGLFAYSIAFRRRDFAYEDVTRKKLSDAAGADKLDLDYSVLSHRRYLIQIQFLTEDEEAQSMTKKLVSIMDGYFSRGFRIVNLQTGAVIGEDLTDEDDTKSYSNNLRDCCLKRPKQYLVVGHNRMNDSPITSKDFVFFGARPKGSGEDDATV
jgi:hypothetical protein